ncbi:MAG TPA: type 1 glutamine amidotransferase [Herpetosiphonaceae bacterium]
MNIHYIQHVPFEGIGSIGRWCQQHGHVLSNTRVYRDEPLPDLAAVDCLVSLGGPMNVYEHDRYPWLALEKRLVEQAIQAGKPVLGICLGAQLVADVLGARVFGNPYKEIGWFPVELTAAGRSNPIFSGWPEQLPVFHWHGDTFSLPAGALRIARSEGCPNQGFLYGDHVVALQFHLEATPESVQMLIEHCADELTEGPYIQTRDAIFSQQEHFAQINQAMDDILLGLCARARSAPGSTADTIVSSM